MIKKCFVVIFMFAFLNFCVGVGPALAGGGGGCGDSKGCQRAANIVGVGGLIVLGVILIGYVLFEKYDSSKKVSDDIEKKDGPLTIHGSEQQSADISADLTVYQW